MDQFNAYFNNLSPDEHNTGGKEEYFSKEMWYVAPNSEMEIEMCARKNNEEMCK